MGRRIILPLGRTGRSPAACCPEAQCVHSLGENFFVVLKTERRAMQSDLLRDKDFGRLLKLPFSNPGALQGDLGLEGLGATCIAAVAPEATSSEMRPHARTHMRAHRGARPAATNGICTGQT